MAGPIQQEFFTLLQVAQYTGRSEGALRQMVYLGRLPTIKWDGRVLVERAVLEELIRREPRAREVKPEDRRARKPYPVQP